MPPAPPTEVSALELRLSKTRAVSGPTVATMVIGPLRARWKRMSAEMDGD